MVIANKAVANSYLVLMDQLGVSINSQKSLVSEQGSMEFAKRLIISGEDLSPIGPKSLLEFVNSPQQFKDIGLNNRIFDVVDVAVLQEQLTRLFKEAEHVSSKT